ncbi:MAG: citramalate synthase [Halanaerobiales bacterium]
MGLLTIYDTTLRDGAQGEGIAFSLDDKLKIARLLDGLGVDYIEGGWPGSNPKDEAFFEKAQELELENSEITAFSSTKRPHIKIENDLNINKLVNSGVDIATIFAKSWDFHVTEALEVSLEENLNMIRETIAHLKANGLRVFFDAEHFFDGYVNNREYAMKTLKVAEEAGAERLILCDTNGGLLVSRLEKIFQEVKKKVKSPLGIHAHNDGGLALANTLAAYENGAIQIQGTIGGIGERCGNVDLCGVIPAIEAKYGRKLDKIQSKKLKSVYYTVMEIANLIPDHFKPYVGKSAFTHKGGIHVSALQKNPATYEHIVPETFGNQRRVLVSELAGKSNLRYKLEELGIDLDQFDKDKLSRLTGTIKKLEHKGYQFEGAEASLKLLVYRNYSEYERRFEVDNFKIISHNSGEMMTNSEAVIKLSVRGNEVHTAAEGDGPVNALDKSLRKALSDFFPEIDDMKLIDYKVRVLDEIRGTAAKVRVLIETTNGNQSWNTVGVSTNIIQASWQALIDSIEYGLLIKNNREAELLAAK